MPFNKHDARHVAAYWLDLVLLRGRTRHEVRDTAEAKSHLSTQDFAFATLLYLTVLRRLGQIDELVGRCIKKPLPRKARGTRMALRLGAAQLLFLDTAPHAAVNTSVELAVEFGGRKHRGLVNAVLRRLDRDGRTWRDEQDAARLNTPDRLWNSWSAAYGEANTRAIAESHLDEPPLDMTAKGSPVELAETLDAELLPSGSLRRSSGGRIEDLPGFRSGNWWVQDAAAALPAKLLDAGPGDTVIDLCAAPGGKTAQLASAGAKVIAVDWSPTRLDRLQRNLDRIGLEVETLETDASEWRPGDPVQAVLLDAPCTATGTIRRHPDILRLRTADDSIERVIATQDRLLSNAATMLAPNGTLVYAVCSLQPEEGPDRIAAFLANHPTFVRVPIESAEIGGIDEAITADGDLRTLPSQLADLGGWDGFYAARLKRRA